MSMPSDLINLLMTISPQVAPSLRKLMESKGRVGTQEINAVMLASTLEGITKLSIRVEDACTAVNTLRSDLTRKGVI